MRSIKAIFILFALAFNIGASAQSDPDECRFLLMPTSDLRIELQELLNFSVLNSQSIAKRIAVLKVAANVLMARTSAGDLDVLKAFKGARFLAESLPLGAIPATVAKNPAISYYSDAMGSYFKIFASVRAKAYPVQRSESDATVIAYISVLEVQLRSPFDVKYLSGLHKRIFTDPGVPGEFRLRLLGAARAVSAAQSNQTDLSTATAIVISAPNKGTFQLSGADPAGFDDFLVFLHHAFVDPSSFLLDEISDLAGISDEDRPRVRGI